MQVKKQQLALDMEQKTGSKLGKEYVTPDDNVTPSEEVMGCRKEKGKMLREAERWKNSLEVGAG